MAKKHKQLRQRKKKTIFKKEVTKTEKSTKKTINKACEENDLKALRNLACSEGFLSNSLRSSCWAKLLKVGKISRENRIEENHKDEDQVLLDVERSFKSQLKKKKEELKDVIIGILRRNPKLSYYQGFHDVCATLLLVLKEKEQTIRIGENIAIQLPLVFDIIRFEDVELADFIKQSSVMSHFCISWVITWCSHDIHDFPTVVRLFDLFIASDPLMPIYFSAMEILMQECEFSTIHSFISKIPQDANFDDIIFKTVQLFQNFPPHSLLKKSNTRFLEMNKWITDKPLSYNMVDEILSIPLSKRIEESQNQSLFYNNPRGIIMIVVIVMIAIMIYWLLLINK
ncbi:5082_t:CDS:2 [Diversispora eburnea]|uniref:5082_t:CDS:1 n=1 Tax=Diversispora eburnea TaxID=1213867 RepID=A0A9N8YLL7_9GLOM|nr:5082_t:CDS:2 [Diversispora eburnea]